MKNQDHVRSLAKSHSSGLSRRNFLRGLGACLALPAFESLHPFSLSAATSPVGKLATTATGAPMRSAFIFFPNGSIPGAWWPTGEGKDFVFGPTLEPLAPTRDAIQVLGQLDHNNAVGGKDGGGDHARGNGVFLTGVRLNKSATDIRAGISIDQMMAQHVGHLTRLPSLELTLDNTRRSAGCDSNYSCAYQYNISWSSPTTPVAAEFNPRLVFERLFGTGGPGEREENNRRRLQERKSILDFVMQDARKMEKRLNGPDRAKLDQYLTDIREIETRIEKSAHFGMVKDPGVETPDGVPVEFSEYVTIMYDLMALAFQTDSTRIASMCLGHDGSNRSFSEIGIAEGHHDLSHHQNKPDRIKKVSQIDLWYAQQFGKFLQKLQNTRDVDGNSVLHNSMIVYGSGNADGNRHSHDNLPLILAGGGGGTLNPGRYFKHGSKPACNLFMSMANRMGVEGIDRFGDSTGVLANI